MLRTCLLTLALLSPVVAVLAETPAASSASAKTPAMATYLEPAPPGELVDIGGRRLHIECKGEVSAPTVIFEAGLSQYTAQGTYGKAQDLIADFARVCTYDRAGLGWSDPVTGARTQQDMVEDLHKLVSAADLKRPLVLVGHSMGGLLARLYETTYPTDVAAMVLVDASAETIMYGPGAAASRQAAIARIDTGLSSAKEGKPIVPMPVGTPAEVMMAFTPSILRTVKQEYQAIDLVPAGLRKSYGTLGDKPLAVIRRGKASTPPSETDVRWREAQEAMTALSTRSFLVVAENAGHVIPYEQPTVVADTVRRIVKLCSENRFRALETVGE